MAEIVLGIGTSHSPMLNATAEEWELFAPREPSMSLLDREGAPSSYEALVREAGGRYDAHCNRAAYEKCLGAARAAMDRLAGEIRRARLDALVIVGDDQKELFLGDNLPALLVYHGETIAYRMRPPKPGWVEWFARVQSRYYPERGSVECPVDAALARHLVTELVERDFDVSAADRAPRDEGEGHAFAFVHRYLMDGGAPLPVVPVFVNAYYPPNQPTPARCYALGQALRAAIESYPGRARVGVLASGGLSHFAIDEALDRGLIAALEKKDAAALKRLPRRKLNSGNSEIRNWIALAGAVEPLPLAWHEYLPAYRSPAGTGTGLCFAAWRG